MPPKFAACVSGRRGCMAEVARAASSTSPARCTTNNGRLSAVMAASCDVGYKVFRLLDVARDPKRVQRGTNPDSLPKAIVVVGSFSDLDGSPNIDQNMFNEDRCEGDGSYGYAMYTSRAQRFNALDRSWLEKILGMISGSHPAPVVTS